MKVCIIFPAYNEEKNIDSVLKEAKKYYKSIIVVDDGSKDRTYEIAKRYTKFVLKHEKNLGKAEAIKTALKNFYRKFDFFIIADSDGQYLIKDSLKFLKYAKNYDLILGFRKFSKIPYFRHRLGNKVLRSLFNLVFGTNFKDVGCGYYAFSKKFAKILEKNIYGGYILEASILINAIKNNVRIKQVEVDVIYKNKSKILRGIRVVLGILVFILIEGLFKKYL